MKRKISRRKFLRWISTAPAAIVVGNLVAACSTAGQVSPKPDERPTGTPVINSPPEHTATIEPSHAIAPTPTFAPLPSLTVAATEPPTPTPGPPDVVVSRSGEPEDLVRRALAALGGMERFVARGARVVIKPNICVSYHSYEYAATTNPWVVGALVKLCLEAGADSVMVMDYPFGGTPEEAYAISGIPEQVKAAGGKMEYMAGFKYVLTPIPQGINLKKTQVYKDILEADTLINVPIAKHHNLARLTLGMKNLMGVIVDRQVLHRDIGQCVADLASLLRPHLTVIDAVRILTANGPTGGSLADVKKLDTVIASADMVAADSFAATLFGLRPEDVPYILPAADLGLGRHDLENLKIVTV
jgi:uncharacterized protein (DUF362 family)